VPAFRPPTWAMPSRATWFLVSKGLFVVYLWHQAPTKGPRVFLDQDAGTAAQCNVELAVVVQVSARFCPFGCLASKRPPERLRVIVTPPHVLAWWQGCGRAFNGINALRADKTPQATRSPRHGQTAHLKPAGPESALTVCCDDTGIASARVCRNGLDPTRVGARK